MLYDYATTFSLSIKCEYSNQAQEELHSLIKRREPLLIFKNQEISRQDTADGELLKKTLSSHLKYLNSQLEKIALAIKEICSNDSEIKDKMDRLTSIPGVGITLATTVVCEVPEAGNIDFRQLTSLVGLATFARDSGQYRGRRSIFAGRANLRRVLYMVAVASLRCNTRLKHFYDRLLDNHKPPKVALVAVIRKFLGMIYAIIKNNSFWSDNYCNI